MTQKTFSKNGHEFNETLVAVGADIMEMVVDFLANEHNTTKEMVMLGLSSGQKVVSDQFDRAFKTCLEQSFNRLCEKYGVEAVNKALFSK